MDSIIEWACEKCGTTIMATFTQPLEPGRHAVANKCANCNHITNPLAVARFQWSSRLRSIVTSVCEGNELKELKINPKTFVANVLNARLQRAGKSQIVIDHTTQPITFLEKQQEH